MAISFPASLDTLTNPSSGDQLSSVTVPHATQHADANDAIEALEAKVGINGSAVTTSHDYKLAQLALRSQIANPIDNASLAVWQRGATIAAAATYAVGPDRWNIYRSGLATGATWTKQLSGDSQGSGYCARVQRDSGNTSTAALYMAQSCETKNSIHYVNQTVTVSFRARKGANYSAASDYLQMATYSGTGVDQSVVTGFTGSVTITNANYALTSSWTTYSVTITVGSTATQLGIVFAFTPVGTAGASDYYEIKDVRIDRGPAALPHAPLSHSDDLLACRRFFRRDGGEADISIGFGIVTGTTFATVQMQSEGPMRAIPTISVTGTIGLLSLNDTGAAPAVTALGGSSITSESLQWIDVTATGGGLTLGRACRVYTTGAVSVDRSAEL